MPIDPLANELKQKLLQANLTIAVAESLTGGNLQAQITSVSGSSEYFLGGITAYNIDQKVNLLNVDRDHAASVNCVSEQVASEMAAGACELFGSDIGVGTTGYAEAWRSGGVEVPYAWIAINMHQGRHTLRIESNHLSRVEMQRMVVESVLNQLLERI